MPVASPATSSSFSVRPKGSAVADMARQVTRLVGVTETLGGHVGSMVKVMEALLAAGQPQAAAGAGARVYAGVPPEKGGSARADSAHATQRSAPPTAAPAHRPHGRRKDHTAGPAVSAVEGPEGATAASDDGVADEGAMHGVGQGAKAAASVAPVDGSAATTVAGAAVGAAVVAAGAEAAGKGSVGGGAGDAAAPAPVVADGSMEQNVKPKPRPSEHKETVSELDVNLPYAIKDFTDHFLAARLGLAAASAKEIHDALKEALEDKDLPLTEEKRKEWTELKEACRPATLIDEHASGGAGSDAAKVKAAAISEAVSAVAKKLRERESTGLGRRLRKARPGGEGGSGPS
jgi:hypothetical protein